MQAYTMITEWKAGAAPVEALPSRLPLPWPLRFFPIHIFLVDIHPLSETYALGHN
jgi:hypothetical protein